MPLDVERLSAKELFELANRKLKEEEAEARRAELAARSTDLKKRRQQLIADHEKALADLEREIQGLHARREELGRDFRVSVAAIDKELSELAPSEAVIASIIAAVPEPESEPESAPETAQPTTTTKGPTSDDYEAAILDALRGRNDISDSLLREKLRLKGLPLSSMPKQLERLIREGKIASKGGGNYALKKRA